MRVLPHAIWNLSATSPTNLLLDAFHDGLLTHGHARALVGAVLYAYAASTLLQERPTLGYGELIDTLLSKQEVWGAIPVAQVDGWLTEFERASGPFPSAWSRTVEETVALLKAARAGLSQGVLADDREVLGRLGCLGPENGAGTITAVAATYLASRYAAQPRAGVVLGAFLLGADTDTLAAMTGGLLGALAGPTWMPTDWLEVQDAPVLRRVAEQLVAQTCHEDWKPLRDADLSRMVKELEERAEADAAIDVLGGRVLAKSSATFKGRPAAYVWTVSLPDGQTIYIKRHIAKAPEIKNPISSSEQAAVAPPSLTSFCAVQVRVSSVARVEAFYRDVLGLPVTSSSATRVSFGGLELVDENSVLEFAGDKLGSPKVVVVLETSDVDTLADRARNAGVRDVRVSGEAAEEMWMHLFDPEGTPIEVRERRRRRGP
jgi:extradiol dioxygenase family protein